jgi:hypothetical protein
VPRRDWLSFTEQMPYWMNNDDIIIMNFELFGSRFIMNANRVWREMMFSIHIHVTLCQILFVFLCA